MSEEDAKKLNELVDAPKRMTLSEFTLYVRKEWAENCEAEKDEATDN